MSTLRNNKTVRLFAVAILFAALLLALYGKTNATTSGIPTASADAIDVFAKFDNSTGTAPKTIGNSLVQGHTGEIEVASFDHKIDNKISFSGTSPISSKANLNAITFTKNLDAASVSLHKALTAGQYYTSVTFTFRKAGATNPTDYYQIVLGTVFVTAVDQSVTNNDGLTETVTLVAGTSAWKNLSAPNDKGGWNFMTNAAYMPANF